MIPKELVDNLDVKNSDISKTNNTQVEGFADLANIFNERNDDVSAETQYIERV